MTKRKLAIRVAIVAVSAFGVFVALSWPRPPDPEPDFAIVDRRDPDSDYVGFAGSAGDFDRDGVGDLLSIEPFEHSNLDALRIYSGATRKLIFSTELGETGRNPCAVVCGDLDGDGIPDVLVGLQAFDEEVDSRGLALLVSGRDGHWIATLFGSQPNDSFGACVGLFGDLDGDGVPDFAVGATESELNSPHLGRGYVQIFSGRTFAPIARVEGASPNSGFGGSFASLGDVDGDCVPDWIAYSCEPGCVGSVCIVSGRTSEILRVVRGDTPSFGAADEDGHFIGLSRALAPLGDVDGDGIPDFAASSRDVCIVIVSGRDGSLITRIPRPHRDPPGWYAQDFGSVLQPAGDVDGDGRGDLIVGSPHWEYQENNYSLCGGRVWIYSAYCGTPLLDLRDSDGLDNLGSFVASLGDVAHDGGVEIVAATQRELRVHRVHGRESDRAR